MRPAAAAAVLQASCGDCAFSARPPPGPPSAAGASSCYELAVFQLPLLTCRPPADVGARMGVVGWWDG